MSLTVYNTMTRKKERFVPAVKGKVKMYVCGITTYDSPHIGHARSYVVFDVIRKYLEYLGYNVKYVQNFTDVDDKIIERARKLKVKPLELSERFIREYFEDMDALGIERADVYPRASEHIQDIIEFIKPLMEKGRAYEVDGSVYFSVGDTKGYGRLSHTSLEELRAGARVEVDSRKKNAMDFALWKRAKKGEISWESPWGRGRPGWHIECSTMAIKHLGESIDIHGGGQDLIFPHHENEISQSEAYTGKKFVKYWIHNGFVTVNSEKMSKSAGNFVTLNDLLKSYEPDAIRFFLISLHYRKPLDFSYEALEDAQKSLQRIYNAVDNIKDAIENAGSGDEGFRKEILRAKESFRKAMDDDFNSPLAIARLFGFIRKTNKYMESRPDRKILEDALRALQEMYGVLGLRFQRRAPVLTRELIEFIIEMREEARRKKDFATSDKIRERLEEMGILLEDCKGGTRWRFK